MPSDIFKSFFKRLYYAVAENQKEGVIRKLPQKKKKLHLSLFLLGFVDHFNNIFRYMIYISYCISVHALFLSYMLKRFLSCCNRQFGLREKQMHGGLT